MFLPLPFFQIIFKALEVGANCLLIDEDTAATNFMIRDEKMISLVSPNKEPITPFVKKVRPLLKEKGVSSILVIGGSGDYFDVADTVMMMSDYKCIDVTKRAMDIVAFHSKKKYEGLNSALSCFGNIATRYPVGEVFRFGNKVAVRSKTTLSYGDTDIDLSGLEQIVTVSQTQALASILQKIPSLSGENISLHDIVNILENGFQNKRLDELDEGSFNGSLAKPRIFEIAGAINRFRGEKCIVQKN